MPQSTPPQDTTATTGSQYLLNPPAVVRVIEDSTQHELPVLTSVKKSIDVIKEGQQWMVQRDGGFGQGSRSAIRQLNKYLDVKFRTYENGGCSVLSAGFTYRIKK